VGKKRKRDVIDVRVTEAMAERARRAREAVVPPTPEQMAHADFVEMGIYDRTPDGRRHRIGKAFKRVARFESIPGLTVEQLFALRAYRKAFDQAEVSEVKSGLDIRPRGMGGAEAAMARLEEIAFAKMAVQRIEARVPASLWPTLRAVALHDKDFKALAIERFGGRDVSRLRGDRFETTIEPRSNTHRQIVREDFMAAAQWLVVAPPAPVVVSVDDGLVEVSAPSKVLDPAYFDEHGQLRPLEDIAEIIIARFFGMPDPDLSEERAA